MVGTKIDLHGKRQVGFKEAEYFAQSKGYRYCEVSAKSGRNINQLFTTVALYVLRDNVTAEFEKKLSDDGRTFNLEQYTSSSSETLYSEYTRINKHDDGTVQADDFYANDDGLLLRQFPKRLPFEVSHQKRCC